MSYYPFVVTEEPDIHDGVIFRNLFDDDKKLSYKSGQNILYHVFMRNNPHYLKYLLRGFIEHSCLNEGVKNFSRETLQRLELCEEVEQFVPKFLKKRQELLDKEKEEMSKQEPLKKLLEKVVQQEEEIPSIQLVSVCIFHLKEEYQLYSLRREGQNFLKRVFGTEKVFQTAVGDMVQGPINDLMAVLEDASFV